jgi:small subunit ribosomal protein S17
MPKKEKVGTVVSNKMEKTIVVAVTEKYPHSKFGKIQNKTVKFKAHDENNVCHEGDLVRIEESRPFSKDKTWRLVTVLEQLQEV